MKTAELKDTEEITRGMVKENVDVFATESSLAVAKDVQGLRAIFEEVCTLYKFMYNLVWRQFVIFHFEHQR